MMINWWLVLGIAVVIEIVTLILRFGFKMNATKGYGSFMKLIGVSWFPQIHHLYYGGLIGIYGLYAKKPLLTAIGFGIALSDIIHHIVLYFLTGDFQFHLIHRI